MKTLHMIGNAHLDLAWIWPWQEGFGEAKATFLSALERLNEFDGFVFTSSSAQYYAWVEENAPDLFERIRQRVAEGRWIICGGWWVQPDCNLPNGEAFIRQGLYGQQYFLSRFGVTATVGYNVDSFGHNGALPQILRKSGMDSYVFLRPMPEDLTLPEGAFQWVGVDGSSVTACRIVENYSSVIGLEEHMNAVAKRFPKDSQHFICFYGVGNHGGGPTIANIRHILAHMQFAPDCRLKFSDPRTYFNAVKQEGHPLPAFRGELHPHAQGCYSVGTDIKRLNRQAEHTLTAAEVFSVLAASLPIGSAFPCPLDDAWKQLLACQFHDILAGASIAEVYQDAIYTLGGVCAAGDRVMNHAVQAISFAIDIPYEAQSQPIVAFNPHSFPVKTVIYHEKGSWCNFSFPEPCQVLRSDGSPVPFQFVHLHAQLDERKRIAILAELPPLGYETFQIIPAVKEDPPRPALPKHVLENQLVRVELDPDTGLLRSYFDKRTGVELLKGPSGYMLAHEDFSDTWGHGTAHYNTGAARRPRLISMLRLEDGPVMQRIQVRFRLGHSLIRQVYTLLDGSPELDLSIDLNNQEQNTCIKLYFDLAIEKPTAWWDLPFGAIARPTDGAEAPMQSWLDVSGPSRDGMPCGMAILSCGIGGSHVEGSLAALTLLRSPVHSFHAPHPLDEPAEVYPYADQGCHAYHCQLLPHAGSWQDSDAVQKAMLLNRPAVKVTETFHKGSLPQRHQGIRIDADNILLSCLKPAYNGDGIILRLWETCGRKTRAAVELCLLGTAFTAELLPFEVKTYRLRPGQPPEECMMTELPLSASH